MIIDFHTHAFSEKVVDKAIPALEKCSGLTCIGGGGMAGLLENIRDCGLDHAVLLNIAQKPGAARAVNDWAAEVNGRGGVIAFGSVHPQMEGLEAEVWRIRELGLRGIKLHPQYQGFDIDAPQAMPIYAAMQEAGLPLLVHGGFDPYDPKSAFARAGAFRAVCQAFPKLTVIAAHLGGVTRPEETLELLCGIPNLYLDTAVCATYCQRAPYEAIIKKHGIERILLGSDFPWESTDKSMEWIGGMALSSGEKDMIFGENARRLLAL